MTLKRVWIPSPCYHGRNVSGVRLIVLHTAEGARTYQDLGNFFQNYNNQVSSHAGADDTLGTIGEYVSRGNAAWTQANYNNAAVALELCGFAAWSTSEWKNNHHNMLRNAADWIAEESAKLGIPITRLSNSQAQGNGRGVCQHVNLGAGGGNHVDCGSGFPMDYVLDMARGGASSQPTTEDDSMPFYLLDVKNAPLCLKNEHKRIRFFCNTAVVTIEVSFINGPANKSVRTSYDLGPQGIDIPDGVNALVIRRGDEPSGGYPLVSAELQT